MEPTLDPIARNAPDKTQRNAQGRPADLWAALMASAGAVLSVICAILFFAGFAENDTRWEHLLSALVLTLGLFILAIAPFAIVAEIARRALRQGGRLRGYVWTLFLMGPWVILGGIAARMTPLPLWISLPLAGLAGLLCLWAIISLVLDRRNAKPDSHVDTV